MRTADQIVIEHLRNSLNDKSCSVGAVLPDDWREEYSPIHRSITVARTGGGEYDIVGDNAQITVNVYSDISQLDASQYAEQYVLPSLRSLFTEPEVFDVSIESKGDYPDVQPYRPRYQIGIQLWLSLH